MPYIITYIIISTLFLTIFCRCAGWASQKEDEEDKAILNDLANGNK
jgi:hypothetical protein